MQHKQEVMNINRPSICLANAESRQKSTEVTTQTNKQAPPRQSHKQTSKSHKTQTAVNANIVMVLYDNNNTSTSVGINRNASKCSRGHSRGMQ